MVSYILSSYRILHALTFYSYVFLIPVFSILVNKAEDLWPLLTWRLTTSSLTVGALSGAWDAASLATASRIAQRTFQPVKCLPSFKAMCILAMQRLGPLF